MSVETVTAPSTKQQHRTTGNSSRPMLSPVPLSRDFKPVQILYIQKGGCCCNCKLGHIAGWGVGRDLTIRVKVLSCVVITFLYDVLITKKQGNGSSCMLV